MAVEFMLSLNPAHPKAMTDRIRTMGESHRYKPIRPWMYSVYVENIVTTIGNVLGPKEANHDVLNAWSNLLSLVLRCKFFEETMLRLQTYFLRSRRNMLPYALQGRIIKTERAMNILAQDVDTEEAKAYKELVNSARESLRNTARSTGRYSQPRFHISRWIPVKDTSHSL